MSLQQLLTAKRIKNHQTSLQELNELREVIERDIIDAALTGLSADRKFATAYNAALQTSKMALACAGYRTSTIGHHQTAFEAVELVLGPSSNPFASYFDLARAKRNTVDYDRAYIASETEATHILAEAKNFLALVESWIAATYPAFKK